MWPFPTWTNPACTKVGTLNDSILTRQQNKHARMSWIKDLHCNDMSLKHSLMVIKIPLDRCNISFYCRFADLCLVLSRKRSKFWTQSDLKEESGSDVMPRAELRCSRWNDLHTGRANLTLHHMNGLQPCHARIMRRLAKISRFNILALWPHNSFRLAVRYSDQYVWMD